MDRNVPLPGTKLVSCEDRAIPSALDAVDGNLNSQGLERKSLCRARIGLAKVPSVEPVSAEYGDCAELRTAVRCLRARERLVPADCYAGR